jgi:hypothetical protein
MPDKGLKRFNPTGLIVVHVLAACQAVDIHRIDTIQSDAYSDHGIEAIQYRPTCTHRGLADEA